MAALELASKCSTSGMPSRHVTGTLVFYFKTYEKLLDIGQDILDGHTGLRAQQRSSPSM